MRVKLSILFVFVSCCLSAQYADYAYSNQYCVVTSKTDGTIQVNEYIISGRVETAQNIIRENNLNDVNNSVLANVIPDLPNIGNEVIKDNLYRWGNQIIQCVQSHLRTEFSPDITPALFSFYRAETADMLWIPNEQVTLNIERTYNSVKYRCIQTHMTLAGWEPPNTPSLWQIIQTGCPEWVQPTGAQDAYNIDDCVTFQGQEYISLINANVWSPIAYPAGWGIKP